MLGQLLRPFAVPLLPLGAAGCRVSGASSVGIPRGAQKLFQLLLDVMWAVALSSWINMWQQMRFMRFVSQTKLLVECENRNLFG